MFSKKFSENEKRNIFKKLQSYQCSELIKGSPNFPVVSKNTKIPSLIGQKPLLLFETLGVNTEWLKTPVQTWEQKKDYLKAMNFLKNIRVLNDVAERDVKWIQDF